MTTLANNQQIEDFRETGYLVLRQFLNKDQTESIQTKLESFISETVPGLERELVFYDDVDDPNSLKQIQKLFEHDTFFYELMFDSPFEQLAKDLLQSEVIGVNMQYFNKPPNTSQPTPPHQDGYYFMLEPNEAVTMWFGLDHVDQENGCVRYIPQSNQKGLRIHAQTQTLGFSQGISDYGGHDEANEVAFNTQPGDLLVHHALTIHRADQNKSEGRQRRALGFIYYSVNAVESPEKKNREQALFQQLKRNGKI